MSESDNSFTLDGQIVAFTPGQTILTAATAAGVYIPHLCAHPDFPPHGGRGNGALRQAPPSVRTNTNQPNGRRCPGTNLSRRPTRRPWPT